MAASAVQLWVDYEPFCFGVIQAHIKLTKVYLKKVISYARTKGPDGGFPKLSWSVWRHMAMNKMLFPESLAWAYFNSYNSVREVSRVERLDNAELMQQSYENNDQDGYKSKLSVNTMEFVIHLFLQQASKISLRTSLVGEEWPRSSPKSRSPSPDSIDSPKMSGLPSILDEGSQLSFILTNLTDIIELLAEPEPTSDAKVGKRLSADAVEALGYIIKAYLPKTESVVPLYNLAVRHRYQNKSGYSRASNDFSCRTLENWIRSSLMSSPFSTAALIDNGSLLPWTMPRRQRKAIMKRSRILSCSLSGHHNVILFAHCSSQTIAQQSPLLRGSSVRLVKCNNAQFYLLSTLVSVSIEKCHDSTFVLGPVSKCIRASGCSNIVIISPCRFIIVSTCSNITVHVATSSQPILIGESSSQKLGAGDSNPMVTLAPYHTFYDQLEQHLVDIGLVISPQIDEWNNPICLSHTPSSRRGSVTNGASLKLPRNESFEASARESSLYRILPPAEFFSFVIPFKSCEITSKGDCNVTRSLPWGLPDEYASALEGRQRSVEKYKSAVRKADMTKAERKKFQAHVEARFKDWLESTGNKRQLDNLVDIAKAFERSKKEISNTNHDVANT